MGRRKKLGGNACIGVRKGQTECVWGLAKGPCPHVGVGENWGELVNLLILS